MKDITATEIEEKYKNMRPLPDHPMTEMAIERIAKLMEEMAAMPRETEPYVRQPGEKCMYELSI